MSELALLKIQHEQEALKCRFQINYPHLTKLVDQVLLDKLPIHAIGSEICDINYTAHIDNKKYIEAINSMKEIIGPEVCTLLLHGDLGHVAYSKHFVYGDFGIKRCVFVQNRNLDDTHCKTSVTVFGIVFYKEVILDPEYRMSTPKKSPIDTSDYEHKRDQLKLNSEAAFNIVGLYEQLISKEYLLCFIGTVQLLSKQDKLDQEKIQDKEKIQLDRTLYHKLSEIRNKSYTACCFEDNMYNMRNLVLAGRYDVLEKLACTESKLSFDIKKYTISGAQCEPLTLDV